MSMAEIEAELGKMSPDELRRLAFKSWSAFMAKESGADVAEACDETDPRLLAALDEAVRRAEAMPGQGHSGQELRTRVAEWTTK